MNQNITSKNTSINSAKLPAIYNKINWDKFQHIKMLDYGWGKFDNAKDYIVNLNGKWFGYDPYNRTELENERVYKEWFNIIVCSNVLNEKTIEYLRYIKDVFGDSFIVKNGVITNHPEYLK